MLPIATYRIQFREGFTLDHAVEVVPYLKHLGISHLYASPIFTATTGSTHGYDVTDHNEIDPAIGGRPAFDRLSVALQAAGMGLILDIVPNHMAASLENPWWHDVIENGQDSRYANHFDIDWRERLTLPNLGKSFDEAFADGEISLKWTAGKPVLAYFDNLYPLNPRTTDGITETTVTTLSKDHAFLAALHERQPYQLTFWKTARRHLSYRRFFEVTGLVGVRVEDKPVFDDVHRLILDLVRSGQVDGLRVDHVDGLADPKAYLTQLREAIGTDTYLVVEKILNGEEQIPSDWPIEGTTGYEFTAAMADLLCDGENIEALDRAYEKTLGHPIDLEAERRRAKRQMVTENFETELNTLVELHRKEISEQLSDDEIRAAIVALITEFPVYRTYINSEGVSVDDRSLLEAVAKSSKGTGGASETALKSVVKSLFCAPKSLEFTTRFQQLTGPVTAKAVEDTLFYRFNKLLALNEVGCDPAEPVGSIARFHAKMQARVGTQPLGMLGTSTHDTKRGEDARARLYALSEAPEPWAEAVTRWRAHHADFIQHLPDGPAPEPDTEWLLYQALLGIWTGKSDPKSLNALKSRYIPFVEKTLREAKRRTDWTEMNEQYETAVKAYASRLLDPKNHTFFDDFNSISERYIAAGRINSLSQTLIKLTAPGIPDIYQGAEGEDLSLVDPDNRRPIDFKALFETIRHAETQSWDNIQNWSAAKQRLIEKTLKFRQDKPSLFQSGAYTPVQVTGIKADFVAAYLREDRQDAILILVPRLPLRQMMETDFSPDWSETTITLPERCQNKRWQNILNGNKIEVGKMLDLTDALNGSWIGLFAVV